MKPTKTLEETVPLMLSNDPKDRAKGQYYQIENYFIELNDMVMEWDLGRLDPVPKGDRTRYGELLGNMRNYMLNLKRLMLENGIIVPESEGNGNDNSAGTE